jgi:hypothetical protein
LNLSTGAPTFATSKHTENIDPTAQQSVAW